MFDTLLSHLSSFHKQLVPQVERSVEAEESEKHPPSAETTKLMQRIKDSRAMLTVKISGSEDTYLSALLEVNGEEGYIVIDELNSQTGHRSLCQIKQLEISTRLEDREIRFQCDLAAIGEQNGISYYKIPFPENLDHQLRRKHLRITAPRGKYLPVHLHTDSQDLVTGELVDLSTGGFGAILSRGASNKIHHGDIIPKCMLYLENQKPIEAELEVRYCEDKRYHSQPRLGGKFINMDQHSERRLQKFISQIDRMNTRNLSMD